MLDKPKQHWRRSATSALIGGAHRPLQDRPPACDGEADGSSEAPYRRPRDLLAAEGSKIGRRHVTTLMKRMGMEVLYRRPRTTKPERYIAVLTEAAPLPSHLARLLHHDARRSELPADGKFRMLKIRNLARTRARVWKKCH